MRKSKLARNAASAFVIGVLIVLAIGSSDGKNGGSASGRKVFVTGDSGSIDGDRWFGCVSADEFDTLVKYAVQKDREAFGKRLAAGLLAETMTTFKPDEKVYVMDTAVFSGRIKVRRQGDTKEYWTNTEAIK